MKANPQDGSPRSRSRESRRSSEPESQPNLNPTNDSALQLLNFVKGHEHSEPVLPPSTLLMSGDKHLYRVDPDGMILRDIDARTGMGWRMMRDVVYPGKYPYNQYNSKAKAAGTVS